MELISNGYVVFEIGVMLINLDIVIRIYQCFMVACWVSPSTLVNTEREGGGYPTRPLVENYQHITQYFSEGAVQAPV